MRSIGIRATPNEIFYCVIQNEEEELSVINLSKLFVPASLNVPEQLKYIRNTFLDIIREFDVTMAGIRVVEGNADAKLERLNYEAVIQELFASSTVEKYFVGRIASISKRLGFSRENFKKYISKELDFEQVDNWSGFNKEQKESILVGLAALNL